MLTQNAARLFVATCFLTVAQISFAQVLFDQSGGIDPPSGEPVLSEAFTDFGNYFSDAADDFTIPRVDLSLTSPNGGPIGASSDYGAGFGLTWTLPALTDEQLESIFGLGGSGSVVVLPEIGFNYTNYNMGTKGRVQYNGLGTNQQMEDAEQFQGIFRVKLINLDRHTHYFRNVDFGASLSDDIIHTHSGISFDGILGMTSGDFSQHPIQSRTRHDHREWKRSEQLRSRVRLWLCGWIIFANRNEASGANRICPL